MTVSGQLSSKSLTLRSGWLLTLADQEPVQLQKWELGKKGLFAGVMSGKEAAENSGLVLTFLGQLESASFL